MANLYWVCGSNTWNPSATSGSGSSTIYKWATSSAVLVTGTWSNTSTTFTTNSSVTLTAGTQIVSVGGDFVGKINSTATGTSFTLDNTPITSATEVTCFTATNLYNNIPTAADSVFFDADATYGVGLSGSSINVSGYQQCRNLTISAGKVTFKVLGGTASSQFIITGSLFLAPNTTFFSKAPNNAFTWIYMQFQPQILNATITTNSNFLDVLEIATVYAAGNTISLADDITIGGYFTFYGGTFNTNNYNMTCHIFQHNNSASNIFCNLGSSTITCVSMYLNATNSTYNATSFNTGTSTIKILGGNLSTSYSGYVLNTVERYPPAVFKDIAQDAGLRKNVTWSGYIANLFNLNDANAFYYDATLDVTFTINASTTINTLRIYAPTRPVGFADNRYEQRYMIVNFKTSSISQPSTTTLTVGNFSVVGTSPTNRIQFHAENYYTRIAKNKQNIAILYSYSLNDCDFKDINVTGPLTPISPTRAGNMLGNSGITFPAPKTVYWVRKIGEYYPELGSPYYYYPPPAYNQPTPYSYNRSWSEDAWSSRSGGNIEPEMFPLAQDTAIFDDNSFTYSNAAYPLSSLMRIQPYTNVGSIIINKKFSSLTTYLNSIYVTQNLYIYGDLIDTYSLLNSIQGYSSFYLYGRGSTQTLKIGCLVQNNIYCDNIDGTIEIGGSFKVWSGFYLRSGKLKLNNNTIAVEQYTGFIVNNDTGAYAKNIDFGDNGTISIGYQYGSTNYGFQTIWSGQNSPSPTLSISGAGSIVFASTANKIFNSVPIDYKNIRLVNASTGTLTVTGGCTFKEICNLARPTTFTFEGGKTTTASIWNLRGQLNYPVTITSNNTTACVLSDPSGTVNMEYINASLCNFTGGASWYAGYSTDGGNNTGITFTAAPVRNRGSFLPLLMHSNP